MNDAQRNRVYLDRVKFEGFINELFGLDVDKIHSFHLREAYVNFSKGKELARKALAQPHNVVLRDRVNELFKHMVTNG